MHGATIKKGEKSTSHSRFLPLQKGLSLPNIEPQSGTDISSKQDENY